jgi:hypothetical protein
MEAHYAHAVLAAAYSRKCVSRSGRFRRPKLGRDDVTAGKSNFAEYHRWRAACLAIAQLSDATEIQSHWLMMAQSWFKRAQKADGMPLATSQNDYSDVTRLRS